MIYRHFCEIFDAPVWKVKQRSSKKERYRSHFVTPLGVGVSAWCRSGQLHCWTSEEMFIASEYQRLATRDTSQVTSSRIAVAGLSTGAHVTVSRVTVSPAQRRRESSQEVADVDSEPAADDGRRRVSDPPDGLAIMGSGGVRKVWSVAFGSCRCD